jgi:lysophospholipase L1-like esterase
MKSKLLSILSFLIICFSSKIVAQTTYKIPKKVQKILFLGNSITYSGQYVCFFEAYLKAKYPKNKFEIINVGLPSETVSGLSEENHADGRFPRPALQERLSRVLKLTKPDLVIANYGMNDGIYLPFETERFQKFKDGIEWLHNEIVGINIPIIHATPPIFDEKKGAEYAYVLDKYSEWLLQQITENPAGFSEQWIVADIHFPMKKFQEEKRKNDSSFALAADGVHPGELGHWIMAQQLLRFIGEKEVLNFSEPKLAFDQFKNGNEILKLITERQNIMKDAWLTESGHKRPEMKVGLPLVNAKKKANDTSKQIKTLQKKQLI